MVQTVNDQKRLMLSLLSPCPINTIHPVKTQIREKTDTIHTETVLYWNAILKAPDVEKWLAAVKLEFDTLVKMGCWEVVDIPIDAPLLGVRWVYKIKHLPFGKGNPGIASMYTTSSSDSTAETNAEVASKAHELNPGMLVKTMTMRSVT